MIELVFVIVVLGILASIAVPRLSKSKTDATITKGRNDIAAIRSAILNERQKRIVKGETNFISDLDAGDKLFGAVLTYGMTTGNDDGQWSGSSGSYTFHVGGKPCNFTYNSTTGKFTLDSSQYAICDKLVK